MLEADDAGGEAPLEVRAQRGEEPAEGGAEHDAGDVEDIDDVGDRDAEGPARALDRSPRRRVPRFQEREEVVGRGLGAEARRGEESGLPREGFEAAGRSAGAARTFRVDGDVPDLARPAVVSAGDRPRGNERAADADVARDVEEGRVHPRPPRTGVGGREALEVGIVARISGDPRAHPAVAEHGDRAQIRPSEVRGDEEAVVVGIHESGDRERRADDADPRCAQALGHRRRRIAEEREHLPRILEGVEASEPELREGAPRKIDRPSGDEVDVRLETDAGERPLRRCERRRGTPSLGGVAGGPFADDPAADEVEDEPRHGRAAEARRRGEVRARWRALRLEDQAGEKSEVLLADVGLTRRLKAGVGQSLRLRGSHGTEGSALIGTQLRKEG